MFDFIKNINLKGDRGIWSTVIILSFLSVLLVYSTEGAKYFFGHLIRIILGVFCLYQVHKIKFKYFANIGMIIYFFSLLLLILVLVMGVNVNGASRWLSFGGMQFQPSDIAKLAVLIFMARQLSKYREEIKSFKYFLLYVLTPLVIVCLLILPNNLSTAILVFVNGLVLMIIAKVRSKFILGICGSAIFLSMILYSSAKFFPESVSKIMPRSATWVSRVDAYFIKADGSDLNKDYQQRQAMVAIYNGGLSGLGPGKSTQRNILPYSSSDFIFAIMVEEYGLLFGGFLPILLYLILLQRSIAIASKTSSLFGGLLSIGLMFSLVLQAFVNMLVAVGVFPVTGQTLPLISMGGTSILFTCITIGIVLSISGDSTDRNYETA
jgi:cell division protein FtsW